MTSPRQDTTEERTVNLLGWTHYCDPPMREADHSPDWQVPALPPGEAWPCPCGRWYGVAVRLGEGRFWKRLGEDAIIHSDGMRP
ncbi:hypothetical protein [Glutamicibacter sp. V16R2B1]|uniref:hypothetical protein n=1 Tax=Glutamicibacter sp. V16R2B1 TaxID=2036207 RepID=UPI0010FD504F|nr:hypothetical protein [Glutamicibacter sp. V16R2B1]MCK9901253.1 hypothetical protein [Frankia sp. Cpl3]TLK47193.1 hypothetical protein FDN03_15895 [Glutamicibacter sp. V16R2B1]